MKNRILFCSIITLALLFGSCNKYTDVTLSSGCFDEFPTSGYYSGQHGKIQSATENDQANLIIIEEPDNTSSVIFACNLPTDYQRPGLEIIFDAEIKDLPDMICDTISADSVHCVNIDILGIPVQLTALKVKN